MLFDDNLFVFIGPKLQPIIYFSSYYMALSKLKYEIACLLIIAGMVVGLYLSFPNEGEYRLNADEGNYMNYALTLKADGFMDGMKHVAKYHADRPDRYVWPSPLRIVHLFQAWVFVNIFDGMAALSWLSTLSYSLVVFLSFRFAKERYGPLPALLFVVLLVTAPLGLGIARRALMDNSNYLFVVATVFTFLQYLKTPSYKWLAYFIVMQVLLVLEKEPSLLFLPGFALVWLVYYFKEKGKYRFTDGLIVAAAVPLLLITAYTVFLGWDNFMTIFSVMGEGIAYNQYNSYHYLYQQGHWYRILLDYALLSPVLLLLGLVCLGYYMAKKELRQADGLIIVALFVLDAVAVTFATLNLRYINYLEWILIFMVAIVLPAIINQLVQKRKIALYAGVFAIMSIAAYNLTQFKRVFIDYAIYDPITYNLLHAADVLPNFALDTFEKKKELVIIDTIAPTPQDLFKIGIKKYNEGDYLGCIAANQKILELNPKSFDAWNNICAAYNQLKEYDKAIDACNKAVALDPTNEIPRNNIEWAKMQKAMLDNPVK